MMDGQWSPMNEELHSSHSMHYNNRPRAQNHRYTDHKLLFEYLSKPRPINDSSTQSYAV